MALPLLVFGLPLIALPSFVLGREFSMVWESMTRDHVITSHNLMVYLPHYLPYRLTSFLKQRRQTRLSFE